jgi:hypothetical protein
MLSMEETSLLIDTEKDQLAITFSIDDVFRLLSGQMISEKAWTHVVGVFAEWYNDTYLIRNEDPKRKKARLDSYSEEQKHVLKEYRILTAFECGCPKCVIPDPDQPLKEDEKEIEIKEQMRRVED